nr:MAG TPA: hypothetical protein [Caudoviricetes sp.]
MKEKIVGVWTAITLALIIAVLYLLGRYVSKLFAVATVVILMPAGAIFLWYIISRKLKELLKGGTKK